MVNELNESSVITYLYKVHFVNTGNYILSIKGFFEIYIYTLTLRKNIVFSVKQAIHIPISLTWQYTVSQFSINHRTDKET